MAESILKLKVDNQEYNSKIERARQGLLAMQQACEKVGGTLEVVEKDELEFAQALGNMATVSNTARGKVNELTKAFTDLSSMYNHMTDEEKSSPFGKAISSSLETLKARVQDGQKELQGIQKELGTAKGKEDEMSNSTSSLGGIIDQFTNKLGLSKEALTLVGAATAAAKLATEAFTGIVNGSQTATDEWGRTTEATTRVIDGLWESLSRGNFNSFINGLQDVIQNARNAYDALDALSSFNAVKNQVTTGFDKRRTKLRADIRKGVNVEEAKKGLKELEKEEEAYYKKESTLQRGSGNAVLISLTGSRNGWLQPYVGMDDAGAAQAKAAKDAAALMKKYYKAPSKGKRPSLTDLYAAGTGNTSHAKDNRYNGWSSKEMADKYNALINYSQLSDEQIQKYSQYYANSNTAESQMYRNQYQDQRILNYGSSSRGKGRTGTTSTRATRTTASRATTPRATTPKKVLSEKTYTSEIPTGLTLDYFTSNGFDVDYASELQQRADMAYDIQHNPFAGQAAFNTSVAMQKSATQGMGNLDMASMLGMDPDSLSAIQNNISSFQESMSEAFNVDAKNPFSVAEKSSKETAKSWQYAAQAISSAGSALGSMDSKAANVAGIIMEAVANVALGFASSLKDGHMAGGPWGWIAAAAAGTATMIATIASIKQATKYAEGGIVKGSSFTGDAIPAMLNAGETVLSAAGTERVAEQLQDGGRSGGGNSTISGEQIVTVINAFGRRTGRGEILR